METKEELIKRFDCNAPGVAGNLFGLPFTPASASVVILPVPWEVTVSYGTGTAKAPETILKASTQVDLAVKDIPDAWKIGIAYLKETHNILDESSRLRELALKHIQAIEGGNGINTDNPILEKVNEGCENLNIFIKKTTQRLLDENKIVGLLGGDHSTPLGLLRSLSTKYHRFGILQIDAHADLRKGYEGFTYSHASIMYNAMKLPAIGRLVQVGIRDYCDEELAVIKNAMGRVVTFFDQDMKDQMLEGKTWSSICEKIIGHLPDDVYISFDIDGLHPKLCPNTGTPVPGGLEFEEASYLIRKLVKSGKRIIGFDLCEVSPGSNEWDANVAARLLYLLCNWTAISNGIATS